MRAVILMALLSPVTSFQPLLSTCGHASCVQQQPAKPLHQRPSLASDPSSRIRTSVILSAKPSNHTPQEQESDKKQQEMLRLWKHNYCSVNRFRAVHGRNKRGDKGDWSFPVTRTFYTFKLTRAVEELQKIGLPKRELGHLAFQARKAIKTYARERSQIFWRACAVLADGSRQLLTTGKFDTKGKSFEQLQSQKRMKILMEHENIDELTEEALEELISLEIFKSAGRPNEVVSYLAFVDLGGYVPKFLEETTGQIQQVVSETVFAVQDQAWTTYEDFVAGFLLDSAKVSFVSPECKEFLRGVFPRCVRKLRVAKYRRLRESEDFNYNAT